jgi:hypothetical protein
LRIRASRTRRYELEASTARLGSRSVCRVSVGGRGLQQRAWHYDGRRHTLRATFRAARRATLRAKLGRC